MERTTMNVERLTVRGTRGALAALVMLAGAQAGHAAGQEPEERYEVLSPGQPPVLVYRSETAAERSADPKPASSGGGTIGIFYPTGGQSRFGQCWLDLGIDSVGNLYPNNGAGIYRLLSDGTLVNGVDD